MDWLVELREAYLSGDTSKVIQARRDYVAGELSELRKAAETEDSSEDVPDSRGS